MKSILKLLLLVVLFMLIAYASPLYTKDQSTALFQTYDAKQGDLKMKVASKETALKYDEDKSIAKYIGKPYATIEKKYGKADRVEQTAYEYEEYVFAKGVQGYMTVGVLADRVVRINVVGNKLEINPFEIGMPIETIINRYAMESEIIVNSTYGKYQLSLSEDDLYSRPLIKLTRDRYAQLTIDSNTHELFAVSFMDSDTLVKLHPYESIYEGDLYEVPKLSNEKWRRINEGMDRDVIDLTNIYRTKHDLGTLVENKEIKQAASAHSRDMHENEFFSHDSATKGNLTKRMAATELVFDGVEENIAANYVDGAATFAAWLSSASHRQTLELEQANVIGVGSFQFYTTQIIGYVAEVTDPS